MVQRFFRFYNPTNFQNPISLFKKMMKNQIEKIIQEIENASKAESKEELIFTIEAASGELKKSLMTNSGILIQLEKIGEGQNGTVHR